MTWYIQAPDPDEDLENTPWQGDKPEPETEYTQEELEAAFVEAFVTDEGEAE